MTRMICEWEVEKEQLLDANRINVTCEISPKISTDIQSLQTKEGYFTMLLLYHSHWEGNLSLRPHGKETLQ